MNEDFVALEEHCRQLGESKAEVEAMRARKDAAYEERNRLVEP